METLKGGVGDNRKEPTSPESFFLPGRMEGLNINDNGRRLKRIRSWRNRVPIGKCRRKSRGSRRGAPQKQGKGQPDTHRTRHSLLRAYFPSPRPTGSGCIFKEKKGSILESLPALSTERASSCLGRPFRLFSACCCQPRLQPRTPYAYLPGQHPRANTSWKKVRLPPPPDTRKELGTMPHPLFAWESASRPRGSAG